MSDDEMSPRGVSVSVSVSGLACLLMCLHGCKMGAYPVTDIYV